MEIQNDSAYRAVTARDARFDGLFFVAVKTTRVYCRPICPAAKPLAKNCRFYATAAAAEQDGYRPCLRCRPELAPGLSPLASADDLARQALHIMLERVYQGEPVRFPELARQLGMTDRHLRRLFQRVHGVSPQAFIATQRLLQAKQLLSDTHLPITQVALSCGFGSIRRFNAAFATAYRLSPRQLRAGRPPSTGPAAAAIHVRLGYRPPLDVAGLLGFFAHQQIEEMEAFEPLRVRRTLSVPAPGAGASRAPRRLAGWIDACFDLERHEVHVSVAPSLGPVLGAVLQRVRLALDLDADPAVIDPILDSLPIHHAAGVRVAGGFDGFEVAVRAITGHDIAVGQARERLTHWVGRLGRRIATPWPHLSRLFPSAFEVAACDLDHHLEAGLTRPQACAVLALARAIRARRVTLQRTAPLLQTLAALRAMPELDECLVQRIAMRALAWPDAFPVHDRDLRQALKVRSTTLARVRSEAWRPFRAYAAAVLTTAADPAS